MFNQDKTEAATPRRRQQAQEKGQFAKSQDLAACLPLLAGVLFFLVMGDAFVRDLTTLVEENLTRAFWLTADFDLILPYLTQLTIHILGLLLGLLVVLLLAGLGGTFLQSGWNFHFEKALPHFERLDPAAGLARIFSLEGVVRGATVVLKLGVCGGIAWLLLRSELSAVARAGELSCGQLALWLGHLLIKSAMAIVSGLIVLSAFDYLWQRYKWERDLRMTVQEVREEMKETLGDPQVIKRRRQRQYEISSRR
ncbi:MAG: EscU/YscU/HrcU family type III secretion system export apparatus switch protein [Planctomycetia bacterium]|nr:EscU/YscU/HrcU family type III secretion system export apparatus switch protein [Planctomycetia bacterium]